MKKIVALVLSLVMVLGLATTAFAAPDKYDMYVADDTMAAMMKLDTPKFSDQVLNEVAAATNKDGSGNVAYIQIGGKFFVKTTTPYTTSYAITEAGETTVLFYLDLVVGATSADFFKYTASVTAFDKLSVGVNKCGYVTLNTAPAATDVYFQTAAGAVYLAGTNAGVVANNYLLDGKVVTAGTLKAVEDHTFVASNYTYDTVLKTNVPTAALCTKCLVSSTAIYKDGKVPATLTPYDVMEGQNDTGYDVVVTTASAPAVDGEKVESAETFDAGIAMYVGMSVMAAAGSAVVLKKKD